jgi:hypothetical protein
MKLTEAQQLVGLIIATLIYSGLWVIEKVFGESSADRVHKWVERI